MPKEVAEVSYRVSRANVIQICQQVDKSVVNRFDLLFIYYRYRIFWFNFYSFCFNILNCLFCYFVLFLSLSLFMGFFLPTASHSVSHFAQLKFTFILAGSVFPFFACVCESKRYGRLYDMTGSYPSTVCSPSPSFYLSLFRFLCLISSYIACDTDSTFAHLLVSLLKLIL